jgi:DegV family protein with EDD domain
MRIAYIDGFRLYAAFWAGATEMDRVRSHLDAINVFPVPDGDTGSNMASTLRSTVMQVKPERHLGRTFMALSEAALLGARGNSGLILAQYLLGAARSLEDFPKAQASELAAALAGASTFASAAVSRPVEGTILTVMRAWGQSLDSLAGRFHDLAILLSRSLPSAREALLDTPNRLPVLAKAGVLDAGGKGFLSFLEGIESFIERGNLRHVTRMPLPEIESPSHADVDFGLPQFRYCTEALILGDGTADPEALRSCLATFGDSIIMGGVPGHSRIHIHTNEPARLFARLESFGRSTFQKADDMFRQVQVMKDRKGSVALVTDSSCDLPQDLLDVHQVHVVPLKIGIGGSEYLDRLTMTPDEFYRHMEKGDKAITSQPSVRDFERIYDFLAGHYESILSIHLSSALSGTWGAAKKAAAGFPNKRIEVVDSRHLCASLGLVVLRAAEALESGIPLEDVLRLVEEGTRKARILVCLKTVRHMVRGGRIGPVKGALVRLLGLKPIISVDAEGRGTAVGKARSQRANLDRVRFFAEEVQASEGLWGYAVAHAHAPGEAKEFAGEMEGALGFGPRFVVDISPVIGMNAGPGSLALAFLPNGTGGKAARAR